MIHFHKKNYVIGLDIDDVLADFRGGYSDLINKDYRESEHFYFSYGTNDRLLRLDDDFWLNLKPKVDGKTLPFMPRCYVSTRAGLNESVSQEWLERNGFPCVPVIHVNGSKSDACRSMGVDVFVDDFIKNFEELNASGVHTLLLDCAHNRQYNVDPFRLMDLNLLPQKLIDLNL